METLYPMCKRQVNINEPNRGKVPLPRSNPMLTLPTKSHLFSFKLVKSCVFLFLHHSVHGQTIGSLRISRLKFECEP